MYIIIIVIIIIVIIINIKWFQPAATCPRSPQTQMNRQPSALSPPVQVLRGERYYFSVTFSEFKESAADFLFRALLCTAPLIPHLQLFQRIQDTGRSLDILASRM